MRQEYVNINIDPIEYEFGLGVVGSIKRRLSFAPPPAIISFSVVSEELVLSLDTSSTISLWKLSERTCVYRYGGKSTGHGIVKAYAVNESSFSFAVYTAGQFQLYRSTLTQATLVSTIGYSGDERLIDFSISSDRIWALFEDSDRPLIGYTSLSLEEWSFVSQAVVTPSDDIEYVMQHTPAAISRTLVEYAGQNVAEDYYAMLEPDELVS